MPKQTFLYHGSPNHELTELRAGTFVTKFHTIARLMGRFHLKTGLAWTDDDLEVPYTFGAKPKWKPDREPMGLPTIYVVMADRDKVAWKNNPFEHQLLATTPIANKRRLTIRPLSAYLKHEAAQSQPSLAENSAPLA